MEPPESPKRPETESLAYLSLLFTPGLGNRSILRLVRRFGSAAEALRAGRAGVADIPGLREEARAALRSGRTVGAPEREWERIQTLGLSLSCVTDADYPANVSAIADPPAILYVRGTIEPRDLVSVAVVGSRSASPLGVTFTERLASGLAGAGVTVVSGFALGVDSAAHRGALRGGGRTIAVLGCGLDADYPRANCDLREEVAASGALVSELPLGALPAPGYFPMRNRVISGLSLGVVVVEGALRSGSLITARCAAEQGREVFAVPGPAGSFRSEGPHRLLKEGAKLVEGVEDILEEIRPLVRQGFRGAGALKGPETPAAPPAPPLDLTSEEARLFALIEDTPAHLDDLARLFGRSVWETGASLCALEIRGAIRELPGKYFIRAR